MEEEEDDDGGERKGQLVGGADGKLTNRCRTRTNLDHTHRQTLPLGSVLNPESGSETGNCSVHSDKN